MPCAKTSRTALLVWRLVTYECPLGDKSSRDVLATCGAWQQGVIRQVIDLKIVGLIGAWRLVTRLSHQAVCTGFILGGP
ncbi:hypothetical protein DEO72_LG5g836 [Vigna unguiculata]|uniref:Uncharacterized protein n=1 Tax=Vigna unguiculata TaxID=3917 RepID=A0A4D6LVR4_VIGUN|nr:hypothetical protein DEO72_LG5g836 [Vigna unguiculata]